MVVKKQSVLNDANLSLWMVNASQAMLVISGEESVLDLKAHHHGLRYAQEVLYLLNPDFSKDKKWKRIGSKKIYLILKLPRT